MRIFTACLLLAAAMLFADPARAQEEVTSIVIGETYPGIVAPFCTTAEEAQRLAHIFENGGIEAGSFYIEDSGTCLALGPDSPLGEFRTRRLVEKDVPVKGLPEKISIVEIVLTDDVGHEYSLFILTSFPVSER